MVTTAEFNLSEEEVIAAAKLHSRRSRLDRRFIVVGFIALLVFSWVFQFWSLLGLAIGGGSGGVVVAWSRLHLVVPLKIRSKIRFSKISFPRTCIELADIGIRIGKPYHLKLIPWQGVLTWRESGTMLLIYTTSSRYRVIPKWTNLHNAKGQSLVQLLQDHVGDAS